MSHSPKKGFKLPPEKKKTHEIFGRRKINNWRSVIRRGGVPLFHMGTCRLLQVICLTGQRDDMLLGTVIKFSPSARKRGSLLRYIEIHKSRRSKGKIKTQNKSRRLDEWDRRKKKEMKRPRVTRLVWFTIVASYHTASLTGRISSQTARRNCRSPADKKKKKY